MLVPGSAQLGGRVAVVVAFTGDGRPIVAVESNRSIVVALARRQRILPEYCVEHADCRQDVGLAVECARARRARRVAS